MKRIFKAALFATTVLAPAAAYAASPGAQSSAPTAANPCDQLLLAIDRPDNAGRLTITKQQAETFKTNNDLNSCRTALNTLQTPAATGSATVTQQTAGAVAPGAPTVTIQQPAPQVIIQQTQPNISVSQGQPEIIVHQPAPIVTVQIPPPEITVRMPKPEVNVAQAQPQVSVQQNQPTVQVLPPAQSQVATVESQRPAVRFSSDEPQVTVNRAGQPTIRYEELGANQQQAAVGQANRTTTGQTTAAGGNQIAVSELQGKVIMGPTATDRFGTITAVIMDTKDKPFVIVDKAGQKYAVDVENVQMMGRDLMLVGVSDTSRFPVWNDSDPANRNVKRLTAEQRVMIKTSG
jgi:DNA gyrase/topoisomerase IV subunit A